MQSNIQRERGGRAVARTRRLATVGFLAALSASSARAQLGVSAFPADTQWVVPQTRSFVAPGRPAVLIRNVEARVEIVGGYARTRLDVHLYNPGPRQAEAAVLLPVPKDAAVHALSIDGGAFTPRTELLRADEARRIYESIVRRAQDPALLEFVGTALLRSSVFPVPAGGTQCVRVGYEEWLGSDGGSFEYTLPRSEALSGRIPWTIEADVRTESELALVHSSSHAIHVERHGTKSATVRTRPGAAIEPGAFRLSVIARERGWGVSLRVHPDASGAGGHFLLLGGVPTPGADEARPGRELTLVIDRSGSMAGGKLDQVRAAALQMVEGLDPADCFNLIDYSSQVASFATGPVSASGENRLAARRYLASLRPLGGTNLGGALATALSQPRATDGRRRHPIVVFLTDGLPTIGTTSEVEIRALAESANPHARRVFALGVGADVNAPLLDAIAEGSGARARYVAPGQNVELEIARLFETLRGPLFTDVRLDVLGADGQPDTRLLRELYPTRLPDLFEGESLVVLGRYTEARRARVRLSGLWLGRPTSFLYELDFARPAFDTSYVPRLWAARKIAYLVDALRQAGADTERPELVLRDPRLAELVEEIVRLSTRYGVLSEYTAFLAHEGTPIDSFEPLLSRARQDLEQRALATRSGEAALQSARNNWLGKQAATQNVRNEYWRADGSLASHDSVQQLADGAFLKRGQRWIEGELVGAAAAAQPDEVVRLGTPEHGALLERLARRGRQSWLSLPGEILLREDGRLVLVQNYVPQQ